MQEYVLRFEGADVTDPQEVRFRASSLQDALEVAKNYPTSEWAELYQDGVALCRMQLVDEGGAWRVTGFADRH